LRHDGGELVVRCRRAEEEKLKVPEDAAETADGTHIQEALTVFTHKNR
jgi:hypothetical protein